MKLSRRELLLMGLGLCAAGCVDQTALIDRPDPLWPGVGRPTGPVAGFPPAPTTPGTPGGASVLPPTPEPVGSLKVLSRAYWATGNPIAGRVLPMGKIDKITVHHEGWTAVWFNDAATTAKRLDQIRKSHIQRLHAGDIGYHYIIDREGRLWQGRDPRYQGAHVSECNPHNLGVMMLGNFDLQRPTDPQLTTLRAALIALARTYRVPLNRIYTHQELRPTECPGTALQSRMVTLRRAGLA